VSYDQEQPCKACRLGEVRESQGVRRTMRCMQAASTGGQDCMARGVWLGNTHRNSCREGRVRVSTPSNRLRVQRYFRKVW
jgi:hypothetical protein